MAGAVAVVMGGWLVRVNCSTGGGRPSGVPVSVVSDDDAVAADLSVSVVFAQGEAQVPGAVGVGGSVLPRGGGADHVVAGHERLSELREFYRVGAGGRCPPCASGQTV